ncbi:MAG TPA: glycosyltransferase family 4 protein [Gaiellaceae bacterium]|jgi:glycosyltransferase involved in cell wall biosynthesis
MSPRVLFVSRERHRLPLTGPQRRKWDALAEVCDYRVLAAAPDGWPTGDDRFHLVPPASPRALDGALFYTLLPARIAGELRRFRPDVAFVQGVHEMDAFLVARRAARVPTRAILDVQGDWHEATRLYGSPLRRLLNPLNDALAPPAVRGADVVRTVSEQTTGLVRALGVEPGGVFPAYVDAEAFLERPPAPLPEAPSALFVGVLERYKSFDTLADAWRRAAPQVPAATLHVVGTGTLAATAEQLVAALPEQTRWTPRLSPEEVAAALDDAWLLALPSRSEGLPRVAVEAVSRGRAVIGGRAGGIPDVVEHERNGVLVDPDSADELAAALARILSDRAFAERLGAEARRTGEEWSVTPEQYAAKVEALVRMALAR